GRGPGWSHAGGLVPTIGSASAVEAWASPATGAPPSAEVPGVGPDTEGLPASAREGGVAVPAAPAVPVAGPLPPMPWGAAGSSPRAPDPASFPFRPSSWTWQPASIASTTVATSERRCGNPGSPGLMTNLLEQQATR